MRSVGGQLPGTCSKFGRTTDGMASNLGFNVSGVQVMAHLETPRGQNHWYKNLSKLCGINTAIR